MYPALLAGLVFGLTAGLAPGPLMTLTVTQTLKHGVKEGVLVALAPLITDLPIIAVSLLVLAQLESFETLLGAIALVGSGYVFYLGWETVRISPADFDTSHAAPRSIWKGATVNALNPHPYLFWATVGGPFVLRARHDAPLAPWLFAGSFYLLLVGTKVTLALLVGRYRTLLIGKAYLWIMRALGVLLWAFGLFLLRDALDLLGWITTS